jgi:hypothetical protein
LEIDFFCTFSVCKVAEYFLRRNEQVDHLPHGKLKVHVIEFEQAFEEFASFGSGRVSANHSFKAR